MNPSVYVFVMGYVTLFMVFLVWFFVFLMFLVVFLMVVWMGVGHVVVGSLHQRWLYVGDELRHVT